MFDFENISKNSIYILNNRYKIIKKIGEGSYGIVYKAEDSKTNNLVAIKQISKSKINDNTYLYEALQKEIEIMRLISHENSVKLIDYFETEEKYNLVMELCDTDLDVELKKRVKETKNSFSELEVLIIMIQFNKILYELQKEHIIHRDLKLKNIMIKYNNKIPIIGFLIKLSDFGYSKVMNEESMTATNLGTPATKAPEIMFGNDYNSKADLWSVGVIIYQLLFDKLPFPAKNVSQLKEIIRKSNGVKLPEPNNNPISDVCFNLIDRLLQKNPEERIDFDDYFNHKFFTEEHKKYLIENINKKEEIEKSKSKIINDINNIKISENENNKEVKNENIRENKKNNNFEELIDFNERFYEMKNISNDKNENYNLYKAKDKKLKKYVFIKQISKIFIDSNSKNKKIFDKEIDLLNKFSGKKNFTEFIGLFITENYYNIIIEYFSGNILENFLKNRKYLSENLVSLILKQLKLSFSELNNEGIVLEYISPKSFAFSYYYNETNFEIKFFDYGLHGIFEPEKNCKTYLLEEAKLGEVNNSKTNILSLGLVIYKILFGEDKFRFSDKEIQNQKFKYLISENNVINKHINENCKNFLINTINKDIEKRYDWKKLLIDDFINMNLNIEVQNLLQNEGKFIIKDDQIENVLDIIKNKMKGIIKYFRNLSTNNDKILENEIYNSLHNEIDIFLLLCIIECKTIKNFLNINADTNKNKIDRLNQEIHVLQILKKIDKQGLKSISNSSFNDSKYNYSFINFINNNDHQITAYYNKENPFFEKYRKIFYELEQELQKIYTSLNSKKNSEISFNNSPNLPDNNEKSDSEDFEMNDFEIIDTKEFKEENIEKLFTKFFDNGTLAYIEKNYEKAIDELTIAKYLSEIIIFIRLILGNKQETVGISKILEDISNIETNNNESNNIMITFIGGKIKQLNELRILGCNKNENNDLNDSFNSAENNIKIYNTMINFFPRINIFIEEVKKEKNNKI